MQKKVKIRKDDLVEVIAGKDKGKRGTVVRVISDKDRVIVAGVNLVKKAMRKRSQQDRGGISEVEAPLHISNVAIVCKKLDKLTGIITGKKDFITKAKEKEFNYFCKGSELNALSEYCKKIKKEIEE